LQQARVAHAKDSVDGHVRFISAKGRGAIGQVESILPRIIPDPALDDSKCGSSAYRAEAMADAFTVAETVIGDNERAEKAKRPAASRGDRKFMHRP